MTGDVAVTCGMGEVDWCEVRGKEGGLRGSSSTEYSNIED